MKDKEVLLHIPLPIFEVTGENGKIIWSNHVGGRYTKALGLGEGATLKDLLAPESVEKILKGGERDQTRHLKVNYISGADGFAIVQPLKGSFLITILPTLNWMMVSGNIMHMIGATAPRGEDVAKWKESRYLEVLSEVTGLLLSTTEIEDDLPRVLEIIREATDADCSYIFIKGPSADNTDVAKMKFEAYGPTVSQDTTENGSSHCFPEEIPPRWEKALSSGGVLIGPAEGFPEGERGALKKLGIKSVLIVPVFKEKEWAGFLGVSSVGKATVWLPEEIELLRASADIIGFATSKVEMEESLKEERQRLEEEVRKRTERIEVLYRLHRELSAALNIENIFGRFFQILSEVFDFQYSAAVVVGPGVRGVYYSGDEEGVAEEFSRELLKKFIASAGNHLRTTEFTFHYQGPLGGESGGEREGDEFYECHVAMLPGEGNTGILSLARWGKPFKPAEEKYVRMAGERLERILERTFTLIKGEEKTLASVLRNLSEGVIVLNPEAEIIFSNPAARKYLPYMTMNQEGKRITGIGSYPLKRILEDSRRGIVRTITLTKPRLKHIQVTAKEISLLYPSARGIILTIRDVTRIEEKKKGEMSELERFASLGQLSVGIAHEFNNFLTSIGGTAEIILKNTREGKLKQKLERILKDVRDASKLTRQITSFARGSESMGAVDILPMVKEFAKMLKRTLPENIETRMEYRGGAYQIMADPLKIRQILLNLTSNARDFMPRGGRITLKVGREILKESYAGYERIPPGEYVILEVSDTGVGMDAETMKRAFDPFFTTKKNVEESTGLGLSVVYSNVKDCGGYIDVRSAPGKGTTFRIFFPASDVKEERSREIKVKGEGKKVLVAEDNLSLLDMERDILSSSGFQVLTAVNGEEALEIIKKEKPSVIVADAVMPRMGGEELYREAKKFVDDLKMVMVSGYGPEDFLKWSNNKGIRFLPKPFTGEELLETIWHLSRGKK